MKGKGMKKLAVVLIGAALAICMFGCSGGESGGQQEPKQQQGSEEPTQEEPKQPLDLTGTWKQSNPNSEDTWHEAVIEGDAITINWVSDGGDTKSLYWAGTYVAPTDAADSYSWSSVNDTEQTGKALLASGDETKEFSYENGVISYEASAMGSTTTVKLEKQ